MPAKKSAKKSAKTTAKKSAKISTRKPVKKTAKKSAAKATSRLAAASPETTDYRYAYVDLRTLLDALEMGSLHYMLRGATSAERNTRAGRLTALLKPALMEIETWDAEAAGPPDCPPGYYECDGCCVPYPCPGNVPPES